MSSCRTAQVLGQREAIGIISEEARDIERLFEIGFQGHSIEAYRVAVLEPVRCRIKNTGSAKAELFRSRSYGVFHFLDERCNPIEYVLITLTCLRGHANTTQGFGDGVFFQEISTKDDTLNLCPT